MYDIPKIPNFDMEGLKTFVTVVKCHSFSEAAALLHKTPATVSYRIKALEDQLGMPLFKRSTRNLELLPAGEHLMDYVTQIYGLLQAIPKNLQQLSLGAEPQFTIIVNNLLYSPEAIGDLLALLTKKFPFTQFEVARAVYMGVWDSLLSNQGQFAIGVPTWHPIANNFITLPLGRVFWEFVVAPSHPLAAHPERVLSNLELMEYPAINVLDTSITLAKRTAWRLQGQREIIVPNMDTKLYCHLKGLGIGFLPEPMVRSYLRSGELVSCKVEFPRTPSPMAIAWPTENPGAVSLFMQELFRKNHPVVEGFKRMLVVQPADDLV